MTQNSKGDDWWYSSGGLVGSRKGIKGWWNVKKLVILSDEIHVGSGLSHTTGTIPAPGRG